MRNKKVPVVPGSDIAPLSAYSALSGRFHDDPNTPHSGGEVDRGLKAQSQLKRETPVNKTLAAAALVASPLLTATPASALHQCDSWIPSVMCVTVKTDPHRTSTGEWQSDLRAFEPCDKELHLSENQYADRALAQKIVDCNTALFLRKHPEQSEQMLIFNRENPLRWKGN